MKKFNTTYSGCKPFLQKSYKKVIGVLIPIFFTEKGPRKTSFLVEYGQIWPAAPLLEAAISCVTNNIRHCRIPFSTIRCGKTEGQRHMKLINTSSWRTGLFLLLTGLALSLSQAAEDLKTNQPPASDPKSLIEATGQLRSLRGQVAGVDAVYEAYTKATESEKQDKLWKAYVLTNDSTIVKILEDVRQAPSSPMAFELLLWVVTNNRIDVRALSPCGLQAMECLRDYHTANPNIGPVCRVLGRNWDPLDQPAIDFLKTAATKNPDRTARGYATFALAQLTKQKAELMAFWKMVPASIYTNIAAQKHKAAYSEESKKADSRTLFQQAEQSFETVTTQYADCPNFPAAPGLRQPMPTLGDQAGIELYECRHLELGKAAPEIQGDDLDGQKLTLTEYHGKVVVLSFWASWCGPCMQMVPHERAMAQRLEGKPFALVGVNGDADRADAKRAAARENMTWRSFWNDGGSEGGTPAAWNVHAWPTVYVLDATGTIQLKYQGYGGKISDPLFDDVVDRLLKEIEAGK